MTTTNGFDLSKAVRDFRCGTRSRSEAQQRCVERKATQARAKRTTATRNENRESAQVGLAGFPRYRDAHSGHPRLRQSDRFRAVKKVVPRIQASVFHGKDGGFFISQGLKEKEGIV